MVNAFHTLSGIINHISRTIPHGNRLQLQLYTDGCASDSRNKVVFLEHVQAIITLTAPKRGDIQIYLTSPAGGLLEQILITFCIVPLSEMRINVGIHFQRAYNFLVCDTRFVGLCNAEGRV